MALIEAKTNKNNLLLFVELVARLEEAFKISSNVWEIKMYITDVLNMGSEKRSELYKSLITNHPSGNSKEEQIKLEILKYLYSYE